ncbi:MAG: aspartate--tRNA ligase [Patescibacteria group bacterium]
MARTMIGELVNRVGQEVEVSGWVHARRDMGKLIFIDLRDRTGLLQVVFWSKDVVAKANALRPEFVVTIKGKVSERPEKMRNPKLATGGIELSAADLEILNESKTPPFELDKDTMPVSEELRLKYRYLDLRTERMQRNLILRDKVTTQFRDFLHKNNFIEVETPCLTKGTPEGSREYIVPSRLHAGKYYVLPQSPQQFKQLLMVAGLERYFQVARCFRDEDQRGDRQPEFTQVDLEMSFVEQEDVMRLVEELALDVVRTVTPEKKITQTPFPRLTYAEAVAKYGNDKPDLRVNKDDPNELAFCWVVDFPFFEKTDEGGWTFTHNPFSAPQPKYRDNLMSKTDIGGILTTQYDLVLNGYEIAGGSIRNHRSEALRKVFEIMALDEEQISTRFGHMLEAFEFGAPPHGGLAFGFDRLVMLLAGEPNIREIIAIPKTGDARDLMMGAPSDLPEAQLKEANIAKLK